MKHIALAAASALAVAFSAASASAAPIILYNTGVDNNGALLADGATDTHYSTSSRVAGGPYVFTDPNGNYVTPSDAKAISIQPGGAYTQSVNTYSISFTLTDISNAMVSGLFAADDSGVVSLNGIQGASTGNPGYRSLTRFTFTSGFVLGLNTLNFTVTDTGGQPSGVLVSGLTGSAGAVPEPATWGLMLAGFGMIGVGLRSRRRSTAVTFA